MTLSAKPIRKTKSATLTRLLRRGKGATIPELQQAASWQPASCRAFLSRLRKADTKLVKEERPDGAIAYRLTSDPVAAGPFAAPSEPVQ